MTKRFTIYLLLICAFIVANISFLNHYSHIKTITPVERVNQQSSWLKVIMIPLDSRPACTQFVQMLAAICNIEVITPPPEMLDNYKQPADKTALKKWLREKAATADTAIISVDMLTHGSLLASRLAAGSETDSEAVIGLLRTLKSENPGLKIYAFNIIPRLLLGDSSENISYQKNILTYSILKDQLYTFENPFDMKKIIEVEQQLPPSVISRYNDLYVQNAKINTELVCLVEEDVLAGLVLGQDDGMPFGIPNINKQKIQHFIDQFNSKNRIIVTRGTDEVALTLLGRIITDNSNYHPKAFIVYSDDDAPRITMPYMPNTVSTTVKEKLLLVGCLETDDINQADFVLYVHIGTEKNKKYLPKIAEQVKKLIDSGYKVALVDLSENFLGSQTVFPLLEKRNADITKLIAYAGWNTTSNSVGTAVTQAVSFTYGFKANKTYDARLRLYQNNLEFLIARFLDDWYFQKDVQPLINDKLKASKTDPYNLADMYDKTNKLVDRMMQARARMLFQNDLYDHSIDIDTEQGTARLYITDLKMASYLPWDRTFEVYVKPELSFGLLKDN